MGKLEGMGKRTISNNGTNAIYDFMDYESFIDEGNLQKKDQLNTLPMNFNGTISSSNSLKVGSTINRSITLFSVVTNNQANRVNTRVSLNFEECVNKKDGVSILPRSMEGV